MSVDGTDAGMRVATVHDASIAGHFPEPLCRRCIHFPQNMANQRYRGERSLGSFRLSVFIYANCAAVSDQNFRRRFRTASRRNSAPGARRTKGDEMVDDFGGSFRIRSGRGVLPISRSSAGENPLRGCSHTAEAMTASAPVSPTMRSRKAPLTVAMSRSFPFAKLIGTNKVVGSNGDGECSDEFIPGRRTVCR